MLCSSAQALDLVGSAVSLRHQTNEELQAAVMFHTFQSSTGLRSPGADSDSAFNKPARTTGSRRISTSNACVECRRRKIRCDGNQPCGQCQWYQHPEACGYSKPAQRVVPSRKLVDKLSSNIEQYKSVLAKLYPNKDLETLLALPREELLDLALSAPAPSTSPSTTATQTVSEPNHGSDGADSLEALEQAPPEDPYWDEARKHLLRVQGISDDVNGLSMSIDRLSSYVGISSITAALKVMMRCAPHVKPLIAAQHIQETTLPSRAGSPPPELANDGPHALPPLSHGQQLVETYFERVHLFFPLIDERKFWTTYLYADRKDSPWLALLNMVFAVGSLASSTAENEAHYIYFNRARQHLTLESFGSGNLEVLQALAIMSGYYMHYLNRPNEAHSLMGGTLRMATALGLHREYNNESRKGSNKHLDPMTPENADSISPEMRRRIWWSLFCLDSWASTTTGRPSLGRMGPSITVLPAGMTSDLNAAQAGTPQYTEQLRTLPLIHASEFCKIATRIQDRLVESPLLTPSETSNYDAEIVQWHDELPPLLANTAEPCPEFIQRVRLVMKWRYQNIRLVLHRPVLLNTALRRCPFAQLSAEEKVAVGKCRLIALKTIEDINTECLPDLISGWNAVWFTFQACMIPLISLFSDTTLPEEAERWRASIETALELFSRMKPWSIAAKRSMDFVTKLYAAYKMQQPGQVPPGHTQLRHQEQAASLTPTQQHYPVQSHMDPHFDYNAVNVALPDMNHLALNTNMAVWGNDPNAMQQLNGFWDDMMWDTNLPDTMDAPAFNIHNEYEFTGASAQDNASSWMSGA